MKITITITIQESEPAQKTLMETFRENLNNWIITDDTEEEDQEVQDTKD